MTGSDRSPPSDRLDRWLWQARFFKTRSLAARIVAGGGVRVNGERRTKPAASLSPGDVLTFAQGRAIRVIRVAALANRRGPASEARMLYEDLAPPASIQAAEERTGPRPTKRARRQLDALRDGDADQPVST